MTPETRYRYEKRIKELSEENARLHQYRSVAQRIYRQTASLAIKGGGLSISWILEQFTEVLK